MYKCDTYIYLPFIKEIKMSKEIKNYMYKCDTFTFHRRNKNV
jgi:hypothetical protein